LFQSKNDVIAVVVSVEGGCHAVAESLPSKFVVKSTDVAEEENRWLQSDEAVSAENVPDDIEPRLVLAKNGVFYFP
jgi:hypothetical protein